MFDSFEEPPRHSPWGAVQNSEKLADGVWSVSTASHGGIRVSEERAKEIPEEWRLASWTGSPFWYEEDLDWVIPAVFLKLFQDQPDVQKLAKNEMAIRERDRSAKTKPGESS